MSLRARLRRLLGRDAASAPSAAPAAPWAPAPTAHAGPTHVVRFPGTDLPPVTLPEDTPLSSALDAVNSPVLFGCRTGLCGTCLVLIEPDGPLPPADDREQELLRVLAPDEPAARLACQLRLRASLDLRAPS